MIVLAAMTFTSPVKILIDISSSNIYIENVVPIGLVCDGFWGQAHMLYRCELALQTARTRVEAPYSALVEERCSPGKEGDVDG